MIRTFAPSAMHWSACDFCFCGSPWALTTLAADVGGLERLDQRRLVELLPADRRLRVGHQAADLDPCVLLGVVTDTRRSGSYGEAGDRDREYGRHRLARNVLHVLLLVCVAMTCERFDARRFPNAWSSERAARAKDSCKRAPPSSRNESRFRCRLHFVKTSLGIWAFGSMVTRFVPAGYQPQHAGETTAQKVRRAVEGLGDLIDGYEFHYPQELSADNLDEVRDALDGHDIYCIASGLHLDPRFGKGGLVSPDDGDARRGAARDPRGGRLRRRARRALHHLARDRGLQLPVPDARTRSRGRGSSTGIGEAAERAKSHGRDDLPRAQELRARDEDPHAEHRDDAARDPQAARPGDRQRQGQHGLAAPDHERREPRRVRGAARRGRAARPPARQLGLGHLRRRQHGRRDRVHGDARARARAAPRRLRRERRAARLRPLPVHRGRGRRGASARVLQWRFIDGVAGKDRRDGAARGAAARRTPSGRTSSCTPRSAHEDRRPRGRPPRLRGDAAPRSRRLGRARGPGERAARPPPRGRARHRPDRHVRRVRPGGQRAPDRRGAPSVPRGARDRDEGRLHAARPGAVGPRRPPRAPARGVRREPAAAPPRADRRLPAAHARSRGSARRVGRRR